MDNVISLQDFLTGDHSRSKVIEIAGIGKLKIFELSSLDVGAIRAESATIPEDDWEANADYIAYVSYRFLSGGKKPSESDIKVLREKLSYDVLMTIYKNGLAFNFADGGQRGDIEKNS